MRVGYLRVSTKTVEQLRSAETQEARLWEAGCSEVLVDIGISGHREAGRKGTKFPELIERILSGVATEVVVPNFDRTQRRSKYGAELIDALDIAGIKLLELDTNTTIDPSNSPADVLIATIKTAVQENESRVRSLKVRNAIAHNRHRGKYGVGMLPFGYRYDRSAPDGHSGVLPDEEQWPLAIRMVHQLIDLECNVSAWLKAHEAETGRSWTTRGVRNWLGNPILRGRVPIIDGACIALLSKEQDEQIKVMLERRKGRRGGAIRRVYPFTGLVRCEGCGKTLHNTFDANRTNRHHRLKCLRVDCSNFGRGIREDAVRRHVIALLAAHRNEAMALRATDHSIELPEVTKLKGQIAGLEMCIAQGTPGLEGPLGELRRQLEILLTPQGLSASRELLEVFADPATVASGSDEQLYVLFQGLVESIVWQGGSDPSCSLRVTLR